MAEDVLDDTTTTTTADTKTADTKTVDTTKAADTTTADTKTADTTTTADTKTTTAPDPAAEWQLIVKNYAGDDAKKAAGLGRYANLNALLDAQIALRDRIARGEIKTAIPKDASPEQVKAWREENGIPEAPDKYQVQADGKPLPDTDIALITPFLNKAHAANMSPAHVQVAVDGFKDFLAIQTAAMHAADGKHAEKMVSSLTKEWGGAYEANQARVESLLAMMPESVRDGFIHARMPNGMGVMNHPDTRKAFLQWANEINPSGTVVPPGGTDLASSIESELKTISDFRAKNRTAYFKDEKMQARERELLGAQAKAKGKR